MAIWVAAFAKMDRMTKSTHHQKTRLVPMDSRFSQLSWHQAHLLTKRWFHFTVDITNQKPLPIEVWTNFGAPASKRNQFWSSRSQRG